jgi:AraC-like DNA-binding protein
MVHSIGAQLRPGAAEILFGCHADAFAGSHAPLADLWGQTAVRTREQLREAADPVKQLDVLESVLSERLHRIRGLHPAVACALEMFQTRPDVAAAVRQSGYSHRRFIVLFRRAVGLTPKLYCRLLRFQRTIQSIKISQTSLGGRDSIDTLLLRDQRNGSMKPASWAGLAVAAGFSDQAHFIREFREFTGVTPEEYRALAPRFPNHLPLRPAAR